MGKGLPGWIGFIVLCGLIAVSSCQAYRVDTSAAPKAEATE